MLHPGADPDRIRLAYSGADAMQVGPDGDLVLTVNGSEIRQKKPLVYQEVDGKRVEVAGGYELAKGEARFALAEYDRSRPLTLDPVLVYSTYLGGSGDDYGQAIAADSTGAAYVAGYTNGSFPTQNATQPSFGGTNDAFVTKFSAVGTVIYSTYLGGPNDDSGQGIAVDSTGAAYVAGYTAGPVGHPVYNNFRADIASLFPGLQNSNGAVGYFVFDTTKLSNGLHTIGWTVTDNGGNAQGLGSRYFIVRN